MTGSALCGVPGPWPWPPLPPGLKAEYQQWMDARRPGLEETKTARESAEMEVDDGVE